MGGILPDGNTMFFVYALDPLTMSEGSLDDPSTYRPLSDRDVIPNSVKVHFPNLVSYTFTGIESAGNYQFFSALTWADAFADGSVDAGDIMALDVDVFTFDTSEALVEKYLFEGVEGSLLLPSSK